MSATLNREDVDMLELAGVTLLRHHESEIGTRLLARALLLRSQRVYACNVDESAGLAEAQVVDLLGYSRKVLCD